MKSGLFDSRGREREDAGKRDVDRVHRNRKQSVDGFDSDEQQEQDQREREVGEQDADGGAGKSRRRGRVETEDDHRRHGEHGPGDGDHAFGESGLVRVDAELARGPARRVRGGSRFHGVGLNGSSTTPAKPKSRMPEPLDFTVWHDRLRCVPERGPGAAAGIADGQDLNRGRRRVAERPRSAPSPCGGFVLSKAFEWVGFAVLEP